MEAPTITFCVDIPAESAQRIATAVCALNSCQPESLEAAMEFTKRWVFRQLTNATLKHEAETAATTAANEVLMNPDDPLLITNTQG